MAENPKRSILLDPKYSSLPYFKKLAEKSIFLNIFLSKTKSLTNLILRNLRKYDASMSNEYTNQFSALSVHKLSKQTCVILVLASETAIFK